MVSARLFPCMFLGLSSAVAADRALGFGLRPEPFHPGPAGPGLAGGEPIAQREASRLW